MPEIKHGRCACGGCLKSIGGGRRRDGSVKLRCSKCRKKQKSNGSVAPNLPRPTRHPLYGFSQIPDRVVPESKVYVLTYAQNATPIHGKFWKSLQHYRNHRNAEIVVSCGRYKNPTSQWTYGSRTHDFWDKRLYSYAYGGRLDLGPYLIFYSDISIHPTASRPTSGFNVFAGKASAVFPHPKRELVTVPSTSRLPRILATTGACTVKNYIPAKAGKKAASWHRIGALIIEREGDLFFMRQVTAKKDGSFTDLNYRYTSEGVFAAPAPEAIVFGDIHAAYPNKSVLDATFGEGGIVPTLKPRRSVYHDLLDMDVRNPHEQNNTYLKYLRAVGNRKNSVQDEVIETLRFLERSTPAYTVPVVVASNHDEMLMRWLNSVDWRQDPFNARFFHELWLKVIETGEYPPQPLKLWYEHIGGRRAKFLAPDERYVVGDIALNYHGHRGANGAKGTHNSYASLGMRTVTGHGHAPGILDDAWRVGVTGAPEYGHLPSSWLNSHCVIYEDLEMTLLHIIEGRWRIND